MVAFPVFLGARAAVGCRTQGIIGQATTHAQHTLKCLRTNKEESWTSLSSLMFAYISECVVRMCLLYLYFFGRALQSVAASKEVQGKQAHMPHTL